MNETEKPYVAPGWTQPAPAVDLFRHGGYAAFNPAGILIGPFRWFENAASACESVHGFVIRFRDRFRYSRTHHEKGFAP